MRGVTVMRFYMFINLTISTHTPHARRDVEKNGDSETVEISTHTPHARRDINMLMDLNGLGISTHTPHARRDKMI